MKRSYFVVPLTLALLFGLALIVTGSPAAYGDNLTACQGTGSSSASVTLAGRSIVPATLLRAANSQGCGNNESALKLVSLNRTLIVSPIGTASQNGQALLTAMTTISNASPSITNPWLLKLEPGSYDLGHNSLILQPYVDLEGSGEGTTTIWANVTTPLPTHKRQTKAGSGAVTTSAIAKTQDQIPATTVYLAAESEVRFVKVVNQANDGYSAAFLADSSVTNARLTHVTAEIVNNTEDGVVLYDNGGSVSLLDSALNMTATSGYAIFKDGYTGAIDIRNSTLNSTGNGSFSYAYTLAIVGGKVTIENSALNASADSLTGIYNGDAATLVIQNSTLTSNAVSSGHGIHNFGTAIIQNSTINSSSSSAYGSGYALLVEGGSVKVGASQLSGLSGAGQVNAGSAVCVASYNGKFTSLTATCGG